MIPPGETAGRIIFEKQGKTRSLNLSELKMGPGGTCVWCNAKYPPPPKRRWCSDNCLTSGTMYCQPQNNATKMWLLIHRQRCACTLCGTDFEEKIVQMIYKANAHIQRYWEPGSKVSYWYLGHNTGDIWEVDHIQPIFKGGQSLGLGNLQTVCKSCHKQKSIKERKKNEQE